VKRDPSQPAPAAAADILRTAGLRRTPVRNGVLEVLAGARGPLAVPQIIEQLPEHTDAVTVYRTLNTFTRKRLVHRVHGEDRTWRYALSAGNGGGGPRQPSAHQHPHFVCDECGTVECLEDSAIPKTLVPSLHVGSRYAVRYPEVVLHGLCPKCHD
jgi:Fur family ferric uptake transcriptional regulator